MSVTWYGYTPENWERHRINNLFALRDERNFKPLSEVRLISLYTAIGVKPHDEIERVAGNIAVTAENYKKVYIDDIIVNIILCWQGAIGLSKWNGVTSPAYDVYRALSQFGDNNVQIAHANSVTINYFSKTQSRINFTDKIDKDIGEFFVKTNLYTQAIEALEKENIVILIGQPGIGKSITSEMVAYDFSKKGYVVLISEEGNISNAKTLLGRVPTMKSKENVLY